MIWEEELEEEEEREGGTPFNFDLFSLLSKPKGNLPIIGSTIVGKMKTRFLSINTTEFRLRLDAWIGKYFLENNEDYYKILEVDYDATEDTIRSNYIRLALMWHPDKRKGEESATSKFQEINEAYSVLSDPIKRREYDQNGVMHFQDYNFIEYLHRFKGLILTCNGLGIRHSIW